MDTDREREHVWNGNRTRSVKRSLLVGVGGGRGVGARENRGWERKGREAVVLRGREAGEKCETLFF